MATREHFSTLEVVTEAGIETVDLDLGKQVVTEGGIEAVDQPVSPVESHHQLNPEIKRPLRSRKLLWITASVVLLAVIFGAVLGGVLGSMKLKRPQPHLAPSSTPAPSSTTTPSSIPSPPPVPGSQSNLLQRRIAAISSDNSSNTTHLYYQDNNGTLFEGTLTPSSETWDFSSIGYIKLNCTGIAAAVSRPGFPSTIIIIYTDGDFLIHDYIYNSTTQKWSPGSISDQKYHTYPNSGLAVIYNQCSYCSNTTIVVYQDTNGYVQAANFTASGWDKAQINVEAIAGTGLAIHSQYKVRSGQVGPFNFADQINLFYQKDVLNISLASWKPAELNDGASGWVTENQVYTQGFPGSPLAAAASNNNMSSVPDWIQVLQLSGRGIGISTWKPVFGWVQPQVYTPSAMSNSTTNAKSYGAVAMTAMGKAFAVVGSPGDQGNASVESWSMNDDLTDWTYTGTVVKWSD